MSTDNRPRLWCPFAPSINKHVLTADRQTLEWARKFHLLNKDRYPEDISSIEYGRFAARVYPNAELAALQIAADWFSWLFLLDDECDETGIGKEPDKMALLHERFLAILHGAETTEDDIPLTHALYDLRHRMRQHSSPAWLQLFTQTVEAYFSANRWEARNRLLGIIPSVELYYSMRPLTGAVYPCFVLFGITDNINLPYEVRQDANVRHLELLANYVICWCNDILSVNKEYQRGDVHNLVIALQHERRLNNTEAMHEAVRIHNATVHEFIELAKNLPHFNEEIDADLARYVECLRHWMRANLDWSLTAFRYQRMFERSPISHTFERPDA